MTLRLLSMDLKVSFVDGFAENADWISFKRFVGHMAGLLSM